MNSENDKNGDSLLTIRIKPKKRSLVERELETNLTARVTSPVSNDEGNNTSRYGRARRLKSDADFYDGDMNVTKIVKSPTLDNSTLRTQSPIHKMCAAKSPDKVNSPKQNFTISNIIDNKIESIYDEKRASTGLGSAKKQKKAKIYVRKDLIQKTDADKNKHKSPNTHLGNILERSSEKLGLDVSIDAKSRNASFDLSSVVKTLDFDIDKKKKKDTKDSKSALSKSDLFEIEAKCEYQVGDLAWARMGTYPFWPCIVTREPISGFFVKKKLFGRVEHDIIHVTFFGDNGRRSWIVDNMLRKYLGIMEFEVTREKFTPEAKKRDPRLYAAFFISEKKQPQWNVSVEEAEVLLREPKRLRIDTFNEMLAKNRVNKTTPKREKTAKISRTNSDVSLSESLYDTLFSEDDGKSDEFDRSKNRCKNKSLDVSEVVTACLDDMAAKTGINRIHKQSHMDRWLQKAKSKTPEKSQSKCQSPLLNSETQLDVISVKNKCTSNNAVVKKTQNGKKSISESHHTSRKSPRGVKNPSWNSNAPSIENDAHDLLLTTMIKNNETLFKNMPQNDSRSGLGIISKVETLCAQTQKDMCSKTQTEDCKETIFMDCEIVPEKVDIGVNNKSKATIIPHITNEGLNLHKEQNNKFNKTIELNSAVKSATVVRNDRKKSKLCQQHSTVEKYEREDSMNTKTTFDHEIFKNSCVKTLFSTAVSVLSNQNIKQPINSSTNHLKANFEETNINENHIIKDDARMSEEKERVAKKNDKNEKECLLQNNFPKLYVAGVQGNTNIYPENIQKKDDIDTVIKNTMDSNSFIQNNLHDKCNNLVGNVTINCDDSLLCKSYHVNENKTNILNIVQNGPSKQLPNLDIKNSMHSASNKIKVNLTTKSGTTSEVDCKKNDCGNKNLNQVSETQSEIKNDGTDIKLRDSEKDSNSNSLEAASLSNESDVDSVKPKIVKSGEQKSLKFTLLNGAVKKLQNISDSTQCYVKITNRCAENLKKVLNTTVAVKPYNKSDGQIKSELLDSNKDARKKFGNLDESNLNLTSSSLVSKNKDSEIFEKAQHGSCIEPVCNKIKKNIGETEHIPQYFVNNKIEFLSKNDMITKSSESIIKEITGIDSNKNLNTDNEVDIPDVLNNVVVSANNINEENNTIKNDQIKIINSVSNLVEAEAERAKSSKIATSKTEKFVENNLVVSPKRGLKPIAASINSLPKEVPAIKSKTSCRLSIKEFNKKKDLPNILQNNSEFRNYFELRQDVLMDENPKLTEYEIISYLYKTWMYEGNGKNGTSIINKIDDSVESRETNRDIPRPKKCKNDLKMKKNTNGNVGMYQVCHNSSPKRSAIKKESNNIFSSKAQKEEETEYASTDESKIIGTKRNFCSSNVQKMNLAGNVLIDLTEDKVNLKLVEIVDTKKDVLNKNQLAENDSIKKKNNNSDYNNDLMVSISKDIIVKDLNSEKAQGTINKPKVETLVKSSFKSNTEFKSGLEMKKDLVTVIVKLEGGEMLSSKNQEKNKPPPVPSTRSSEHKKSQITFLDVDNDVSNSKFKLSPKIQVSSSHLNEKNDLDVAQNKTSPTYSVQNREKHCSEPKHCIPLIVKKEVNLEIESLTNDDCEIMGNICSETNTNSSGNMLHGLTQDTDFKNTKSIDVRQDELDEHPQLVENSSKAKSDENGVVSDNTTVINSDDGTSTPEIINKTKVKIEKEFDDWENKPLQAVKNKSDFVKNSSQNEIVLTPKFEIDTVTVKLEDSETFVSKRKVRTKKLPTVSTKASSDNKDTETASLDSIDIAVPNSKLKFNKKYKQVASTGSEKNDVAKALENPDFRNYLELRQDVLMDENPQLTQDEIVTYLYKTWMYEDNSKSATDKCEDIAVKGLNTETIPQPKKYKKKVKLEKEPIIRIEDIMYRDKPKRSTVKPVYVKDYSDLEDELECFEIHNFVTTKHEVDNIKGNISKKKSALEISNISNSEQQVKNEKVIILDEVDDSDDENLEEMYFAQLTKSKPNIFKGLVREKVCDSCEKPGNLAKCIGCHNMFHVDCATKKVEVKKVELLKRGRKKRKKAIGRTPKSLNDSGSQESESQSDDKSHDPNVSEDGQKNYLDEISNLSPIIVADADNFEAQLSFKMKEILETSKNEDYDTASDCEIDWSGTIAGKCEIVDVKLKIKSENHSENLNLKCFNCQKYDIPVCFVCKSNESPKNKTEYRQRCQVAHCYKYYHLECLDHWPQTQFNSGEPSRNTKKVNQQFEGFMCPKHVCHTCVSDDPRGCKTRFSGDKLARCVRCPATYHSLTKCLPAGSQILTGSHIICPRHYEHRPGKVPCHVNTGWCFICALGGSLICCEYCPTSFHAECLNIKPPEGGYMCEDCETGRLPLYGEMVWVKLGHYRWWPGIILHPSEIPENIHSVKHSFGEFVVRFFGQYDHYWVNRGRVFPFQEGDSGRISSQKSKIDEAFTKAIEHANRACEILKGIPPNTEEHQELASTLLPPRYVKLKVNKPCGSLCGRKLDIEEHSLTQCECDPKVEDPCGPYSQCLNRMLLTECGPSCRAGDRCNNRAFEKRLYPKMVPYPTPHRGWGLKTLQDIKQGQFVIEYVGELIDEEEFKRRMRRQHEIRDENFYFLTLDKERMIDAGPKGNLARFMNHCCEPNCETQKWTVLGDVRVGLFAIRDIPANSEVTFNYNLECAGIEKKRCMCGAKRCSGYIGAKPKQDDSQTKKIKPTTKNKRPYKKRKPEESPSRPKTQPKSRKPKLAKPRELTEIEKDLLIIKNATNGLSSDSESSTRLSSIDEKKCLKPTKRKRVSFSTEEIIIYDGKVSPSVKRVKLNEVGD